MLRQVEWLVFFDLANASVSNQPLATPFLCSIAGQVALGIGLGSITVCVRPCGRQRCCASQQGGYAALLALGLSLQQPLCPSWSHTALFSFGCTVCLVFSSESAPASSRVNSVLSNEERLRSIRDSSLSKEGNDLPFVQKTGTDAVCLILADCSEPRRSDLVDTGNLPGHDRGTKLTARLPHVPGSQVIPVMACCADAKPAVEEHGPDVRDPSRPAILTMVLAVGGQADSQNPLTWCLQRAYVGALSAA